MPKVISTEEHEGLMLHYMLLTRQMASLSDSLLHIIRLDTRIRNNPEKKRAVRNGFVKYAQTELADIICQVKRIGEILGIDYSDTEQMGEERYIEKKEDFIRKYPFDHWI